MKKSAIRFEHLRRILLDLGFTEAQQKSGWWFEHAATGAAFGFRRYRLADRVYEADLFKVRIHLDWRGLMVALAFEDALAKTPA